jgi:predicted RNA-binding protein with PIN domain
MARMLWLIDGYNVIRRDPDLRSHEAQNLEAGRRALVRLVKQLARTVPRDEFVVVFDGARMDSAPPAESQVRILFSRPPETADDLIIRLAGRSRAGSVVVTSDRAVQQAADRARASVIGAESFLAQAVRAAERRSEDSADVKGDDHADNSPSAKRGNPRRLSKKARATARALKRLRPPS